jgi:hypothetical protein
VSFAMVAFPSGLLTRAVARIGCRVMS